MNILKLCSISNIKHAVVNWGLCTNFYESFFSSFYHKNFFFGCNYRNHLGSLILYSGDWLASHIAPRCTVLPTGLPVRTGLKSPFKIHGVAGIACYASCVTRPKFSFPTCKCQPIHGSPVINLLQKQVLFISLSLFFFVYFANKYCNYLNATFNFQMFASRTMEPWSTLSSYT